MDKPQTPHISQEPFQHPLRSGLSPAHFGQTSAHLTESFCEILDLHVNWPIRRLTTKLPHTENWFLLLDKKFFVTKDGAYLSMLCLSAVAVVARNYAVDRNRIRCVRIPPSNHCMQLFCALMGLLLFSIKCVRVIPCNLCDEPSGVYV